MTNQNAFISYAWENEDVKKWVKNLATKLRSDGVDAKLDQWEVAPGDQLPHFMEKSVRDNDYVLIICSPVYKSKSENRQGGVGYEGDIMTAEVHQSSNHRKFIPILMSGNLTTSIPSWLKGKYFIDLSDNQHFDKNYEDLITTLNNSREKAPQLGSILKNFEQNISDIQEPIGKVFQSICNIKILGILVDEVTSPIIDGSRGSALYTIPFELSEFPANEWIDYFIEAWNHPSSFTTMHRPGIASITGNKIILKGTTIDEVDQYHKVTLKSAVTQANKNYLAYFKKQTVDVELKKRKEEEHSHHIKEISKKISFDESEYSPKVKYSNNLFPNLPNKDFDDKNEIELLFKEIEDYLDQLNPKLLPLDISIEKKFDDKWKLNYQYIYKNKKLICSLYMWCSVEFGKYTLYFKHGWNQEDNFDYQAHTASVNVESLRNDVLITILNLSLIDGVQSGLITKDALKSGIWRKLVSVLEQIAKQY